MGLFQSSHRKDISLTPEAQQKAALAKTLEDVGLARFFGRYMSGVIDEKLAMDVMNEHIRKAERQGPVVRALKIIFT